MLHQSSQKHCSRCYPKVPKQCRGGRRHHLARLVKPPTPHSHTLPPNVPDGEVTLVPLGDQYSKCNHRSARETFTLDTTAPVLDFDADTTTDKPADNAVDSQVSFELTATDLTKVSYSYCLGSGCTPSTAIASFPLTLADSEVPFGRNSITLKATDELGNTAEETYTWNRYRCTPGTVETQPLTDQANKNIGTKSRDCAGTGLTWGSWQVSECIAGYDSTQDSTVCSTTMAGFFSSSPQTGRTDCSTGVAQKPTDSHWRKSQRGLTRAEDCAWDCNKGFYKNGNECTAVTDGHVAAEGSTEQTPCQGNQVPGRNKSTCENCPSTKHANPDNSQCVPNTEDCAITRGEGRKNWDFTHRRWMDCQITSCEGGYDNVAGSTRACAPTVAGFFSPSPQTGRTDCSSSTGGVLKPTDSHWRKSLRGLTRAADCAWDCNNGFYKSGSSCTAVADGFVAAEGATQPIQCENNQVPNKNKSACKDCPVGKHSNSGQQ